MARYGGQYGFSLVELMVVSAILVIIFGGSFKVLKKARETTSAQASSAPHRYFESFATSRLKLFFSKLLQWSTHVDPFCSAASRYAYASNMTLTLTERELETLGTDMRMSLSTFSYEQASQANGSLAGRFDDLNNFPWGALVPFDSRQAGVGSLLLIQPALSSYCANNSGQFSGAAVAAEMCAWVDVCSGQEGDRSEGSGVATVDSATPLLVDFSTGSVGEVTSLASNQRFRMCFAFVGNLFSRTGDFVGNPLGSSTGTSALDNPASLGLAVATANFINLNSGGQLNCEDARHEMNRGLSVDLELFSVLNADKEMSTRRQIFMKSQKRFVSEKFGVAVPNCKDTSRSSPANGVGEPYCIGDPTYFYSCQSKSCVEFKP